MRFGSERWSKNYSKFSIADAAAISFNTTEKFPLAALDASGKLISYFDKLAIAVY